MEYDTSSFGYAEAKQTLGQFTRPFIDAKAEEAAEPEPNQKYIRYCDECISALQKLQQDLQPEDTDIIARLIDPEDQVLGVLKRKIIDGELSPVREPEPEVIPGIRFEVAIEALAYSSQPYIWARHVEEQKVNPNQTLSQYCSDRIRAEILLTSGFTSNDKTLIERVLNPNDVTVGRVA